MLGAGGSPFPITATYNGDPNFTGSVSSAQTLTITPASTATTITFTPASITLGNETAGQFTPTLTPTPAAAGTPTGTVTVSATNTSTNATTVLCTLPAAQATGANSCSPGANNVLVAGTYTVIASYPGDPNFTASAGTAAGTLTVSPGSSSSLTLTLTPSATTVTYGNEATVTYGVNFGSASPAPTGTVTVAAGATTLCTVTLAAGAGSCAITPGTALGVAGSPYSVTATYGGDANYIGLGQLGPGHPGRDPGRHHDHPRTVAGHRGSTGPRPPPAVTVTVTPSTSGQRPTGPVDRRSTAGRPVCTVTLTATDARDRVVLAVERHRASGCRAARTRSPPPTPGDPNFTGSVVLGPAV